MEPIFKMDPWQRWPWLWAQHAETRHPLCGYRGATWCFMPWKRSQTVRYCSDLSIQSSLCWSHSLWYSMKTLLPRECSLISFEVLLFVLQSRGKGVMFPRPRDTDDCTKKIFDERDITEVWQGHPQCVRVLECYCSESDTHQRSSKDQWRGGGGRLCVHILNRTSTVRQSVFWKNYKVKTYIYYIAKSIGSPPSNEQVWLL